MQRGSAFGEMERIMYNLLMQTSELISSFLFLIGVKAVIADHKIAKPIWITPSRIQAQQEVKCLPYTENIRTTLGGYCNKALSSKQNKRGSKYLSIAIKTGGLFGFTVGCQNEARRSFLGVDTGEPYESIFIGSPIVSTDRLQDSINRFDGYTAQCGAN